MLDRILEYSKGATAKGVKNITLSDDILTDHFPERPIYPGALLVEAAAQLGGFLVEMTFNEPGSIRRAMLAQIDRAKFYRPAEPGDQLIMDAAIEGTLADAAKINILVTCNKQKVAKIFLTFVLQEIKWPKIHDQRRSLYQIWTRHIEKFPEIL